MTYTMSLQDVLIDEAESDSEEGAAGGDNAVDNTQLLSEVVAQDSEGGCVH
jgi:hypothetical protein